MGTGGPVPGGEGGGPGLGWSGFDAGDVSWKRGSDQQPRACWWPQGLATGID